MNNDESYETGVEIISDIFEKINAGYKLPTYSSGIAGAAWTIIHLQENDFLDLDCDNTLVELDNYLYQSMNYYIEENKFDYLHGAIGIGLYFLKRYQTTKRTELKNIYKSDLIILLNYLIKSAIEDKQSKGVKWESYEGIDKDQLVNNFGLAHGIPSIIYFLNKTNQLYIEANKAGILLNKSIKYLLHNKLDEKHISVFPTMISKKGTISPSRLAWCYGDLGIASVLSQNKDSLIYREAESIFLKSTKRTDLEINGVIDAGICHGAFGIAHMYNRKFQITKNTAFKEAALYWLSKGVGMAVYTDGYAGFKKWTGFDEKWINELNLLEGVAGIGLVIISMISNIEPKWDECLLLS